MSEPTLANITLIGSPDSEDSTSVCSFVKAPVPTS